MLSGIAWLLFLAAFSFLPTCKGHAAAPPPFAEGATPSVSPSTSAGHKLIVLVADALDVELFASDLWVHLRRAAEHGAVGLMNSRTASTPSATGAAAAHATIGAGARLPGTPGSGWAHDGTDDLFGMPATALYKSLTGKEPPEEGIVVLGIASLRQAAAAAGESNPIGALGRGLKERGLRAAVLGNADGWDGRSGFVSRRHGPLIAMDEDGFVSFGSIGDDTLAYDGSWPFGRRTDYEFLWNALQSVYDRADLIVVELGDFARLDAASEWIHPERYAALARQTAVRVDEWIGRLTAWPPAAGVQLVLVSPSPPTAAARAGRWLTPIVWTVVGTSPPTDSTGGAGLVTSRTTRRLGIVANTDLAPSFLAVLDGGSGLARADRTLLSGDLPPTVPSPGDAWEATTLLYRRAVAVHGLRPVVIQTFILSAIILFLTGAVLALARKGRRRSDWSRGSTRIWAACMLLLSSAPLAMLLAPLFPGAYVSAVSAGAVLVALTAASAAIAHTLSGLVFSRETGDGTGSVGPFVIASSLTALAIVADAWFGSRLMKSSFLGFDPIVGARYYGIGNEYMGVLIGTALVGAAGWLDLWARGSRGDPAEGKGRFFVLLAFAIVCGTLAAPDGGANVGGTLAAVTACGVTAALLFHRRLSIKTVVWAGAGAVLLLLAAAAFDAARGEETASHLGRTIHLIFREGPGALAAIAARKAAMNVKLLRWTIWAQVFLVCLGLSAATLLRPSATAARLESRFPRLLHGIRGTVVGALVALVANDSGIVAAATAMIPVTATFMHLIVPSGSRAPDGGESLP